MIDGQIRIDVISIVDCDWNPDGVAAVVCDETNNPPSVIDAGLLNVDIYVKG